MALLPKATVTLSETAGAVASGLDLVTVIAAVTTNADSKPRLYANVPAIYTAHGHNAGLEYAALHFKKTGKPVLFVPVPIVTAGTVSRENDTGRTGTSACTITGTPTDEFDGELTCIVGGTRGTDSIVLGLSLDGGRTVKRINLGVASTYAIPYSGITLNFGAGTFVAGDVIKTWHCAAPRWNAAGLTSARNGLDDQTRLSRSWLVVGDLTANSDADDVLTEVNAYETTCDRFVLARCSVRDRLPVATMSEITVTMTGSPTITFLEVGATADTITRSSGSFIADGFVANDRITITGAVQNGGANNLVDVRVAIVTALVLTLDTGDLENEGPISGVAITGSPAITFAEVGATADTITRSRGSWVTDGFRSGDILTVTGTALNNGTTAVIDTVTALVITLTSFDLVAEGIRSDLIGISSGETKTAWKSSMDAMFADIDDQKRIDLSLGRGRLPDRSIDGWLLRRPASWDASLCEYDGAHDVHIPVWRVSDGSRRVDLNDEDGNLVEWDERVDGGDTRFTSWRTFPNKTGTYLSLSLTRAKESSLLSRTHNAYVAFLAQQIVSAATTDAIGTILQLKSDGTATPESLNKLQTMVESQLRRELLVDRGKGPRASAVSWVPSATDVLNTPGATLSATLTLELNGTIEQIETVIKIPQS